MNFPIKNLIVCVCGILPFYATANDKVPTSVTLMTYNIQVGRPMSKSIKTDISDKNDLDAIAEVIKKYSPDIVGMQEVDCEYGLTTTPPKPRSSHINQARYLSLKTGLSYAFGGRLNDRSTKGGNPKYIEWGTPDHWFNNGEEHAEVGNAMLFKHPFKVLSNIALPVEKGQTRRCAIRSAVYLDGKMKDSQNRIIVYNTHLQHDNPQTRIDQVNRILESAKKDAAKVPVFIMGDLNHQDDSIDKSTTNPIRLIKEAGFHDLTEIYAKSKGEKGKNTWPASKLDRRIDYIFSSKPYKVLHADAPLTQASDHVPVVVTIEY